MIIETHFDWKAQESTYNQLKGALLSRQQLFVVDVLSPHFDHMYELVRVIFGRSKCDLFALHLFLKVTFLSPQTYKSNKECVLTNLIDIITLGIFSGQTGNTSSPYRLTIGPNRKVKELCNDNNLTFKWHNLWGQKSSWPQWPVATEHRDVSVTHWVTHLFNPKFKVTKASLHSLWMVLILQQHVESCLHLRWPV